MQSGLKKLLVKTLSRNCDDMLECDLVKYVNQFGDIVYQEIMILMTGKEISAAKSRRYWYEALSLRSDILKRTEYLLSIRSSLLEVIQKQQEFRNLVFIEARCLDKIRHTSITDGLTGLYNQTYLKSLLDKSLKMRRRSDDSSSALILIDLDHFKYYNDHCGHMAGDEALRIVAELIGDQIREQDIAARYGGDEFAVYLPNVTNSVAFTVANRIRKIIGSTEFTGQEGCDEKRLTASCGIAFFSEETDSVKKLIEVADRELYNAKRLRNCISPDSSERRRHQRYATQALLECIMANNGMSETAMACNFSNAGVGVWSNMPVSPEDTLTIRLSKPFWAEDLEVNGFVRQIFTDKDSGLCYLGIEFEKHINDCSNYIPVSPTKSAMAH